MLEVSGPEVDQGQGQATVEDDRAHGVAAGEGVAADQDEMVEEVGPGPFNQELDQLVDAGDGQEVGQQEPGGQLFFSLVDQPDSQESDEDQLQVVVAQVGEGADDGDQEGVVAAVEGRIHRLVQGQEGGVARCNKAKND